MVTTTIIHLQDRELPDDLINGAIDHRLDDLIKTLQLTSFDSILLIVDEDRGRTVVRRDDVTGIVRRNDDLEQLSVLQWFIVGNDNGSGGVAEGEGTKGVRIDEHREKVSSWIIDRPVVHLLLGMIFCYKIELYRRYSSQTRMTTIEQGNIKTVPVMNWEDRVKLLPFQIPHTEGLIEVLHKNKRGADCSETGTGKIPCAIVTAKTLQLKVLVLCPLSVVSNWFRFLKIVDCPYYGVANYEKFHNCRYYSSDDNDSEPCPFVERVVLEKENKNEFASKKSKHGVYSTYRWRLPPDCLVIFDEAHRCKNPRTLNSVLLFTLAATTNNPILMLSATLADKPESFGLFGFVLGLYPSPRMAKSWIASQGRAGSNPMVGVHKNMFPSHARRMRIRELGALFPKNTVICECYDMETAKEIEEQYHIIADEVERLKNCENRAAGLATILYARMKIEQLRIPTMLEMARQLEAEGNSVVLFANFTNTVQTIAEELKTKCIVYGEQSRTERDGHIERFQQDKEHYIVCNIDSGKEGISLHDLHGNRPRCSLLPPTYNCTSLVQSLGRIHRAEGKTPSRQWILWCKDTIEEIVCRNIKQKLENLGALNDGDLGALYIEGLSDESTKQQGSVTDQQYEKAKYEVLLERKNRLLRELQEVNVELSKLVK